MLIKLSPNLFVDISAIKYFDGEVLKLNDGSYLEPKDKEEVRQVLEHVAHLNFELWMKPSK